VLRGNDARLRLRREVDARCVPRWGAGAVDSLDSRRGAAPYLAMPAPPPPPSAGKVTGQTRMLFFRHEGKTSSIPMPVGGLTASIIVVARRRKEYHAVAALEGAGDDPSGACREAVRQHAAGPYLARQLSTFRPRGVPGPTSKLSPRVPAQMGRREMVHEGGRETAKGKPAAFVLSCAQVGSACSRGVTSVRVGEREKGSLVRRPVLPRGQPPRTRALDLPFIGVRRGPRCTMGGVAVC
jgi:hypothetical protein